MGRKALLYGTVLIGTYILVAHATGAGNLLVKGGSAGSGFVKTLQGR